jgi:peptidoglycan/xylan/chitin deacetylase (PgdA/CDA1 family)
MILGYHRVADESQDWYETCVTTEHFAQHMQVLRKHANPIRLSELVHHLSRGSLPAGSVAVTFDDGYLDNFKCARPLLERYQIPATVFVCTGYLGKEFWWDELIRLVMTTKNALPDLRIQLKNHQFLGEQLEPAQRTGFINEGGRRKSLHQALYGFLLLLDSDERDQALQAIRTWAELTPDSPPVTRAMNADELSALVAGGLVDVGAHTRTHPMLPNLSPERQREEITASKRDVETILDRNITGFAYPNGKITKDALKIVREAGFEYACISLHDVVRPQNDLYQLTRFWQKNVNGEVFYRGLSLWMKQ